MTESSAAGESKSPDVPKFSEETDAINDTQTSQDVPKFSELTDVKIDSQSWQGDSATPNENAREVAVDTSHRQGELTANLVANENDEDGSVKTPLLQTNYTDETISDGNNIPPKKSATLADLIQVCRNRGLQVFNDKPNVPESDKRWQKASREIVRGRKRSVYDMTPVYDNVNDGRSVGQLSEAESKSRSNKSRRSRRDRIRSKRSSRHSELKQSGHARRIDSLSSRRRDFSTDGSHSDSNSRQLKSYTSTRHGAVADNSPHHRQSAVTRHEALTVSSSRQRMTASSRLETLTRSSFRASSRYDVMTRSTVRSILDLYDDDADIDAEEVLQLRMRRKSKRRSDSSISIIEMIKMKQMEVEALPKDLQTIADDDEIVPNHQEEKSKDPVGVAVENNFVNSGDSDSDKTSCTETNGNGKDEREDTTGSYTLQEPGDGHTEDSPQRRQNSSEIVDSNVRTSTPQSITNAVDENDLGRRSASLNCNSLADNESALLEPAKTEENVQDQAAGAKIKEIRIKDGETTLVLYGVTALPSNNNIDNSTSETKSNDSLSDRSTKDSNIELSIDPAQTQSNESAEDVKVIKECQSGLSVLDYSTGGNNEMINKNVSHKEKVNEAKSPETDDNNKFGKQYNHNDNGFLKNESSFFSSSSSVDVSQTARQGDCEHIGNSANFSDEKEIKLNVNFKSNNLCQDEFSKAQTDINSLCREKIVNNSSDLNSDKDSPVTSVEQQSGIDDSNEFRGTVGLDRKATDSFNELDNKVNRDVIKQASDCCIRSPENGEEGTFKISMYADNLIVQKQTVESKDSNLNSPLEYMTNQMLSMANTDKSNEDESIKSKTSYGNGFLVSYKSSEKSKESGSEDIKDKDIELSNSNREIENNNNNNSGRSTAGTKDTDGKTTKKSIRHSVASSSKAGSISASSISSASTPFKKIHSAARLMLLMSQLKKSYEVEEHTQQSFLKEIGSTRKMLRSNYHKLRNGEDIESPKSEIKSEHDSSMNENESEVSLHLPVIDDTPSKESNYSDPRVNNAHKGNESSRNIDVKLPEIHNDDGISEEDKSKTSDRNVKESNDKHSENGNKKGKKDDTDALKDITNFDEIVNESASSGSRERADNISEPKTNESVDEQTINVKDVKSKIDTHWDQDSEVYKQIKTGFKSTLKIPDSSKVAHELKKLQQLKFVTGNIPSHNVYIEDARQRYLQLQNASRKQEPDKVRVHAKTVSRPKTEKEKSFVNDDFRPYINDHRTRSTPRFAKTGLSESKTMHTGNHNAERATYQNKGEANSFRDRNKPYHRRKQATKQSIVDQESEKLDYDKKIINEYEKYMDSKEDLPQVDALNHQTNKSSKHRYRKGNSTKSLPELEFATNCVNKTGPPTVKSLRNKQISSKSLGNHIHKAEINTQDDKLEDSESRGYMDFVESQDSESPELRKSLHGSKLPIAKAVEIVQSRSKFYEDASEIKLQGKSREARVLKLLEELQKLKFSRRHLQEESEVGRAVSSDTIPSSKKALRKFLMMDYGFSDYVLKYRSNLEMNRFLHEEANYETCSKGRELYRHPSRREKALENLRQKFYTSYLSIPHQTR